MVALLAAGCAGNVGLSAGGASNPGLAVVNPGPSGVVAASAREDAPPLEGTTLDGRPLSLASMRGQVVVLNFWASWCPPCRAEASDLQTVFQQTRAGGVSFLGVDIKDDLGAARRFQQLHAVAYPSLYDQPGVMLTLFRRFAPQTPPTTLVVDRQGRIAARFIGQQLAADLIGPVQQIAQEGR